MEPIEEGLTVEEGLKRMEDRAAMLRFLTDAAAATTHCVPEPSVFSGFGDTCGELERMARAARQSLPVDPLGVHIRQPRGRPGPGGCWT